jgi:hypothetical protein
MGQCEPPQRKALHVIVESLDVARRDHAAMLVLGLAV